MVEALIVDAVRTPRGTGKIGKGKLAHMHPQHLAATVMRAIADRNDLNTADVDDIIWSTSTQIGKQGFDLGRMAALDAGYDTKASGVTISRYCGGGISSATLAAGQIMSGMEDVIVAGGTEMMSFTGQIDHPDGYFLDAGNLRLRKAYPQPSQGVAADAVAALEGISRADLDAYALESQRRAAVAIDEDRFARSLIAVRDEIGEIVLEKDEHPRPGTTAEGLASLKPAFERARDMAVGDDGTTFGSMITDRYPDLDWPAVHHAGNSSGVVDGAAALLIASPSYAQQHGLKPRARIVAFANVGDDPTLMLNAPVPAARKVLAKAGLGVDDIDLWEVNEAFAVVSEKFIRDLGLDRDKVNVNGGAIALGHPIGATGAMLIGTLLDELERQDLKRGLVTMCAAGGMAPAIIIERV